MRALCKKSICVSAYVCVCACADSDSKLNADSVSDTAARSRTSYRGLRTSDPETRSRDLGPRISDRGHLVCLSASVVMQAQAWWHANKMKQARAWEHPDGLEATVSELRALLRPYIVQVAAKGLAIYPSDDLELGKRTLLSLDCEKLAENFCLLAKGILVDLRGGIFSQSALYEAFTQELAENKVAMEAVKASAFSAGKFGHEIVSHLVHKIRVMFAHVRSGKAPHDLRHRRQ